MIEELTTFSTEDLDALDGLMRELSPGSRCDEGVLRDALSSSNSHIYVIRHEGRIAATGTLCIKHTPEFVLADIEAVVVSPEHRGRGYGKALVNYMIDRARALNVHHLQLTSNPAREAANRLYQELGFERYNTNCYKFEL